MRGVIQLADEQKAEVLDSGQLKYENRIGWAVTYLVKAKAVYRSGRGQQSIPDVGSELLEKYPEGLTERDLRTVEGYVPVNKWGSGRKPRSSDAADDSTSDLDPIEQVEDGIARINEGVATELVQLLHEGEPASFQRPVVDLIVAMGYGRADAKAARTQLSNDG